MSVLGREGSPQWCSILEVTLKPPAHLAQACHQQYITLMKWQQPNAICHKQSASALGLSGNEEEGIKRQRKTERLSVPWAGALFVVLCVSMNMCVRVCVCVLLSAQCEKISILFWVEKIATADHLISHLCWTKQMRTFHWFSRRTKFQCILSVRHDYSQYPDFFILPFFVFVASGIEIYFSSRNWDFINNYTWLCECAPNTGRKRFSRTEKNDFDFMIPCPDDSTCNLSQN